MGTINAFTTFRSVLLNNSISAIESREKSVQQMVSIIAVCINFTVYLLFSFVHYNHLDPAAKIVKHIYVGSQ
jgi:hypothetical protein